MITSFVVVTVFPAPAKTTGACLVTVEVIVVVLTEVRTDFVVVAPRINVEVEIDVLVVPPRVNVEVKVDVVVTDRTLVLVTVVRASVQLGVIVVVRATVTVDALVSVTVRAGCVDVDTDVKV